MAFSVHSSFVYADKETTANLLIACDFSISVWETVLHDVCLVPVQNEIIPLYQQWVERCPFSRGANKDVVNISQLIPKVFWWNIWLSKNNFLFNNIFVTPQSTAQKIKCHFVEMARKMKSPSTLPIEIANWLGSILAQVPKVVCIHPTCPSPWRIRKSGDEFNS